MNDFRQRNLRILELSHGGGSHSEIARRFKLSRLRIDMIVQQLEEKQHLTARGNRLLDDIRTGNDLDQQWQAMDLIDALRPLPVTRWALKKHFDEQGINTLNLRTLMDLTIPLAGKSGFPPLLKVCGVGAKGFWTIVNRLANLDLGVHFNNAWNQRLAILRRAWRIKDKFPYSEVG